MKIEYITSRKNPLLQHIRKLFSNRSYRKSQGQYAADGVKLLAEALRWIPQQVQLVVVTQGNCPDTLPEHIRVVQVPEDVMAWISPMETPQGAVFVCTLPDVQLPQLPARSLVLDGIQDPGNLGTILRTADALEVPVILTPGCADAYSHKTVRASMGAIFRTQPMWMEHEQLAEAAKCAGIPLYVTALSERACDIRELSLERACVVIGSEGQGVGKFFLEHADRELIIPMSRRCESLNAAVAATIVLWQMKR